MMERISEIKANFENILSLIENEILEQRKEIHGLTGRIQQLENYIQGEKEKDAKVPDVVKDVIEEPVLEVVYKTEEHYKTDEYYRSKREASQEQLARILEEKKVAMKAQEEERVREMESEMKPEPEPRLEPKKDVFSLESDEDNLFEVIDVKTDDTRKSIIGDIFSISSTIGDAVRRENPSWMDGFPGNKVDNVADAITLNDRIIFVRELFEDDNEQFILTVGRLNEMESLDAGVSYLRAAFPEWNEDSDSVCRFYMIVRRRFRS